MILKVRLEDGATGTIVGYAADCAGCVKAVILMDSGKLVSEGGEARERKLLAIYIDELVVVY